MRFLFSLSIEDRILVLFVMVMSIPAGLYVLDRIF
jgi:hypothetical protein